MMLDCTIKAQQSKTRTCYINVRQLDTCTCNWLAEMTRSMLTQPSQHAVGGHEEDAGGLHTEGGDALQQLLRDVTSNQQCIPDYAFTNQHAMQMHT